MKRIVAEYGFISIPLLWICIAVNPVSAQSYEELATAEVNGNWIQPAQGAAARPVWGHRNGIRIGLAPMPGPRGLLRVYTPYLGHAEEKMINFIAFEPVVKGENARGFSELEMSRLDHERGKRFWSSDTPVCSEPGDATYPARGVIEKTEGGETLTVYVFSEAFSIGAKVFTRLRFYDNRPYEVELSTHSCKESEPLDYFILTATMGNFARLRVLYLDNDKKSSHELWPDYSDVHFTEHVSIPADEMIHGKKGGVYFVAGPDEREMEKVTYSRGTKDHWKYYGELATQYWYCPEPSGELNGLVNGRYTYWASESPIPGGISFENFELKEPFREGARYVFGIVPGEPEVYIRKITGRK